MVKYSNEKLAFSDNWPDHIQWVRLHCIQYTKIINKSILMLGIHKNSSLGVTFMFNYKHDNLKLHKINFSIQYNYQNKHIYIKAIIYLIHNHVLSISIINSFLIKRARCVGASQTWPKWLMRSQAPPPALTYQRHLVPT